MNKDKIKKRQAYSFASVAFLYMIFKWAGKMFFTENFCLYLFIGGLALLFVMAIAAHVYLYVRYNDNSRLSWLCSILILLLMVSQILVLYFPSNKDFIGRMMFYLYFFILASTAIPPRYKGEELNYLSVFAFFWITIPLMVLI